jgi:hypothetical protein
MLAQLLSSEHFPSTTVFPNASQVLPVQLKLSQSFPVEQELVGLPGPVHLPLTEQPKLLQSSPSEQSPPASVFPTQRPFAQLHEAQADPTAHGLPVTVPSLSPQMPPLQLKLAQSSSAEHTPSNSTVPPWSQRPSVQLKLWHSPPIEQLPSASVVPEHI